MAGTFNIDVHSLLNTIDAVMAENYETNEWLEALKHNVNTLAKTNDREYNRGLDDCWEMIKKIYCGDGIPTMELDKIFPKIHHIYLGDILLHYTPQEALKRIEEYEVKKKEEEEEEEKHISIGDWVKYKTADDTWIKGIVIHVECYLNKINYYVLCKEHSVPQCIPDSMFEVVKTGKHTDLYELVEEE